MGRKEQNRRRAKRAQKRQEAKDAKVMIAMMKHRSHKREELNRLSYPELKRRYDEAVAESPDRYDPLWNPAETLKEIQESYRILYGCIAPDPAT